jgi:ubiquinone/menaquinone biosynthesis C-methylase UbiE
MFPQKKEDKICNEMDELEKLLSLDGKRILELGCGKAEITRFIATNGYGRKITATEVDQVQHKNNICIKDLPNVDFLMTGAESIPLEDGVFDVVFMFKSLHHVPVNLMDDALSEVKRVLKPGGIAYISEPVFKGYFNEVLRIFHDEEEVRKLAYCAINRSINSKELLSVAELFFNVKILFENFDVFEEKIIKVTHTHHELSSELIQKVKDKFLVNMTDGGATFLMPIRVNLLKKI